MTSLAIKADDLAKAFLNKDSDAIKAMATDNTKDEAGRLIEEYRGILTDSTVPIDKYIVTVGDALDPESDQPRLTIDFQAPLPDDAPFKDAPAHARAPRHGVVRVQEQVVSQRQGHARRQQGPRRSRESQGRQEEVIRGHPC